MIWLGWSQAWILVTHRAEREKSYWRPQPWPVCRYRSLEFRAPQQLQQCPRYIGFGAWSWLRLQSHSCSCLFSKSSSPAFPAILWMTKCPPPTYTFLIWKISNIQESWKISTFNSCIYFTWIHQFVYILLYVLSLSYIYIYVCTGISHTMTHIYHILIHLKTICRPWDFFNS